jgi:hypothetical protein
LKDEMAMVVGDLKSEARSTTNNSLPSIRIMVKNKTAAVWIVGFI